MPRLLCAILLLQTAALPLGTDLVVDRDGELVVSMTLECDAVDWAKEGAESAVVAVFIDGLHHHDVVLHSPRLEHAFVTGPLAKGTHRLRVDVDHASSPIEDAEVDLVDCASEPVGTRRWLLYAPVLYGRPTRPGRKPLNATSDTPLVMYATEAAVAGGGVEYTYEAIWSNEDGGTGTMPALLKAKYGRTTDIEWVFRVRLDAAGRVEEETYQAAGHGTKRFTGERVGLHPVLQVTTDNNNLAQVEEGSEPEGVLRFAFAPALWDDAGPRERVMDAQPWTYRVANAEMMRERGLLGPKASVGDARDDLLVEADLEAPSGTKWRFGAKVAGAWHWSDRGLALGEVEGSGWVRTAIPLPPGTPADAVQAVRVRAVGLSGEARVRSVRAFRLGRDFWPQPAIVDEAPDASLTPDRREWTRSR